MSVLSDECCDFHQKNIRKKDIQQKKKWRMMRECARWKGASERERERERERDPGRTEILEQLHK
jgi:hypothetical protein